MKRTNKTSKRTHDKGLTSIPVFVCDLRALLFWASVGVHNSFSGSYRAIAERPGDIGILRRYADRIHFPLPFAARFREP